MLLEQEQVQGRAEPPPEEDTSLGISQDEPHVGSQK